MIGVSPIGLITIVSACYGGRCSDKAIFEQSQIIQKLEPFKDCVMVDKGFLIEDICHKYSVGLIRPCFLRNKKKRPFFPPLFKNIRFRAILSITF